VFPLADGGAHVDDSSELLLGRIQCLKPFPIDSRPQAEASTRVRRCSAS
jgi:hypothetical protein